MFAWSQLILDCPHCSCHYHPRPLHTCNFRTAISCAWHNCGWSCHSYGNRQINWLWLTSSLTAMPCQSLCHGNRQAPCENIVQQWLQNSWPLMCMAQVWDRICTFLCFFAFYAFSHIHTLSCFHTFSRFVAFSHTLSCIVALYRAFPRFVALLIVLLLCVMRHGLTGI